jgi:hypothetical protein
VAVSVYAPDYAPPTRDEIAEAIGHAKASLDRARAHGTDGPALWAIEGQVDALLEAWVTARA